MTAPNWMTQIIDTQSKKNNKKQKIEKDDPQIESLKDVEYGMDVALEPLPEAYKYLEYISVEYPSQTICKQDKNLIFTQSNGKKSSLISAKFKNLEKNAKFIWDRSPLDCEINRLRCNEQVIVGISDKKTMIFNKELEIECEILKSFSYGLDVNKEKAFLGTKSGKIVIYDLINDKKETFKPHEKGIDGLRISENLLFSASNDKTLIITDLRTMEAARTIKNDCDINTVDINNNSFIYGDDNGIVTHCDLRNEKIEEKIKWHKSPINSVYFSTENIFASVSDEQVALFDTSLVPEKDWTAHHWLWFVHRGQKFYKEICTLEDKWAVTSVDGIAIFQPVQELEEDSDNISDTE